MQLAQENNFPSLPLDSRLQCNQCLISHQFSFEPLSANPTADEKRDRRAPDVADECNQKAPPEAEEKASANA
jgi:hypothetical protein